MKMIWTAVMDAYALRLHGEGLTAAQIAQRMGIPGRGAVIGRLWRLRGAPPPDEPKGATEAEIERLIALAGEGRTTREIAAVLRFSETKVRRIAKAEGVEIARAVATYRNPNPRPPRETPRFVIAGAFKCKRVSIMRLGPRSCRYVLNDPLTERAVFCGNETEREGSSWCAHHAARVFDRAATAAARKRQRDKERERERYFRNRSTVEQD